LNQTNWTALSPDVTAASNIASTTDLPAAVQRFYRVVVLY
jgi:hypothetical protein